MTGGLVPLDGPAAITSSCCGLTTPAAPAPGGEQVQLTIAPQQANVVMALTTAVQQALQATAPIPLSDPLRPYRLMTEAAEKKYQLTSRSLAEILELNISTVHSWGKVVSRNGFLIRRVGAGRWRVEVEDEEGELAA